MARIAFIRRVLSNKAVPVASGVAPPTMPLLPPCGTIGVRVLAARLTIALSSAAFAGATMAMAAP